MQGFSVYQWTFCEIPRDDLFSDDFGFKINRLVCNHAHIFILRRPLIILFKNIVYFFQKYRIFRGNFTFSSMETMETKLGVNHPTIGISQKVHRPKSRTVRRSAIHNHGVHGYNVLMQ
jgi:hypothetical protein